MESITDYRCYDLSFGLHVYRSAWWTDFSGYGYVSARLLAPNCYLGTGISAGWRKCCDRECL